MSTRIILHKPKLTRNEHTHLEEFIYPFLDSQAKGRPRKEYVYFSLEELSKAEVAHLRYNRYLVDCENGGYKVNLSRIPLAILD